MRQPDDLSDVRIYSIKRAEDLCHAEYIVYRRQLCQIHRLASEAGQRPSEYLRLALDDVLSNRKASEDHEWTTVGAGETLRDGTVDPIDNHLYGNPG